MKYFAITAFLSLLGFISIPNEENQQEKELKVEYLEFDPLYINTNK